MADERPAAHEYACHIALERLGREVHLLGQRPAGPALGHPTPPPRRHQPRASRYHAPEMRVAVGGMSYETSTFTPAKTDLESFRERAPAPRPRHSPEVRLCQHSHRRVHGCRAYPRVRAGLRRLAGADGGTDRVRQPWLAPKARWKIRYRFSRLEAEDAGSGPSHYQVYLLLAEEFTVLDDVVYRLSVGTVAVLEGHCRCPTSGGRLRCAPPCSGRSVLPLDMGSPTCRLFSRENRPRC